VQRFGADAAFLLQPRGGFASRRDKDHVAARHTEVSNRLRDGRLTGPCVTGQEEHLLEVLTGFVAFEPIDCRSYGVLLLLVELDGIVYWICHFCSFLEGISRAVAAIT
jgi:hypothetical protein